MYTVIYLYCNIFIERLYKMDIVEQRRIRKINKKINKANQEIIRKQRTEKEITRIKMKEDKEKCAQEKIKKRIEEEYAYGQRSLQLFEPFGIGLSSLYLSRCEESRGYNLKTLIGKSEICYSPEFDVQCPVLFDLTHCIGFNTKEKAESLKIFHIDRPTKVLSVPINTIKTKYDYWFRHQIRPNRIYVSDADGIKVYDFQLNLLFEKDLVQTDENNIDVYGFEVDKTNWNNFWIWSANESFNMGYNSYENKVGLGSIAKYYQIHILS